MKIREMFYEPNTTRLSMSKVMLVIVFFMIILFMIVSLVKVALLSWNVTQPIHIPEIPQYFLFTFCTLLGYAFGSKVTRVYERKNNGGKDVSGNGSD